MEPFSEPIYITRPVLPDLDRVVDRLRDVWGSKCLTNMGDQHGFLERKLREVLKVPGLSLFNNGTTALIAACKVLELKGEVITTPFTFPATAHALVWNGITPVFCDIDPETLNIDAGKIEDLITSETTAILPVHVFGTPCDVGKIQAIADQHGLKVIYDAAHAFGVEINGRGIGTFGDISMFSFHATKLFHTAEGGALTYNDPGFRKKIYYARNFGIKNEEEVVDIGVNGKMNEIQAALGVVVLDYVEEEKEKRKKLEAIYRRCLGGVEGVSFLSEISGVEKSYQYFVVKIDEDAFGVSRDEVYEKLKGYNVFTRKYFYPLCSNYSCYKDFSSTGVDVLPVANKVVKQTLSMPFYGGLAIEDVEKICNMVKLCRK